MNKKYYLQLLLITFLLASAGCKKWLDVSPKTQVREGALLSDEQGFKDAMIGVYTLLGAANTYGDNLSMGVISVMGQNYSSQSSSSNFYYPSRYDYTVASSQKYIADIWGGLYTGVANINNVLMQVDEKRPVFSANSFNQVKGEALGLRALLHFDLLRMFGVSPASNANQKAIPYVTRFGISVYPLLPVNAVIDSCLKDLAAAEQLLSTDKSVRMIDPNDNYLSYTRNHFNYWAVKGLQARIYLYRGDKAKALAAAKEVINAQQANFPFVTFTAASASSNQDRTYATEHLFALNVPKLRSFTDGYTKTSALNVLPVLVQRTTTINTLYESSAGGSSDIRYVYLFTGYSTSSATTKYWQDGIADNSGYEYLRNNVPIIRVTEMYYIAAECAPTAAEGIAYLNTVRKNRGLVDLSSNLTAAALQDEILKEYKKELYAEGQLFFYFKRMNTARVDGSTINMTDDNWTFPLPEDEIEFAKRF